MKIDLVVNTQDNSSHEVQQSSNQSREKFRKRSRPFTWQRRRKRKQLNFKETAVTAPCTRILVHEHRVPENCDLKNGVSSYNEKVIHLTECRSFNRCFSLTSMVLQILSCHFNFARCVMYIYIYVLYIYMLYIIYIYIY